MVIVLVQIFQCGTCCLTWAQLEDGSYMDLSDEWQLELNVVGRFTEDLEIRYVEKSSFDESGDKPPAYACTIATVSNES